MILPEMRKIISMSYEILSSRFCRASTRGDLLSEKLNQLVEQRHSALGYGPKQQQTGLYQPFEVSNAQREF